MDLNYIVGISAVATAFSVFGLTLGYIFGFDEGSKILPWETHNESLKPDQFVCAMCKAHYDIARMDVDVDDDTGIPSYCPNCGMKVVE